MIPRSWPVVALAVAACAGRQVRHVTGAAMGTSYSIKYVAGADLDSAAVAAAITARLRAFDAVFSTWDPNSVICRFNDHGIEPFVLPADARAEFLRVLELALEIAARTDGAFDPTVLPVVDLLGFGARPAAAAPTETELAAALAVVGWQRLHVLADGRLQKDAPGVRITLSAIAKGAGVDAVAAVLAGLGVDAYMVEIGGEVVARGRKPDGARWTLGVEAPTPPGSEPRLHTTVELDGALATSGDYRNAHLVGDHVVHHILDPRTGGNVRSPWASVAVVADTCALADALATAFMVIGPEAAAPLVASYADRGVGALFMRPPDDSGQVGDARIGWPR